MVTGSGSETARERFLKAPDGGSMYTLVELSGTARYMARTDKARVADWGLVITSEGRVMLRVLCVAQDGGEHWVQSSL